MKQLRLEHEDWIQNGASRQNVCVSRRTLHGWRSKTHCCDDARVAQVTIGNHDCSTTICIDDWFLGFRMVER